MDVQQAQQWDSRGNFFATAAEAMSRILVEKAREKRSHKHRGDRVRLELSHVDLVATAQADWLLNLNEALQRLEQDHPSLHRNLCCLCQV